MDADEKLLEERKIALEEQKLQLARDQLQLEKRKSFWTPVSVMVSVLAAAGTISYGLYSVKATARSQFAIKTAELIFSSNDGGQMFAKAHIMADFYGDELPDSFQAKLADKKLQGDLQGLFPDVHMASKIELLKEIVAHPEDQEGILLRWEWMFPLDKPFLDEYRAAKAKGVKK
jgi:hypothetical protein